MGIKLFFIDLDNTLLNDKKEVSSYNKRIMIEILNHNHQIFLTSGRPNGFVENIRNQIDPRINIISYNGGYCENMVEHTLNFDEIKFIIDKLGDKLENYIIKTDSEIYASKHIVERFIFNVNKNTKAKCYEGFSVESLKDKKIFKFIGFYAKDNKVNLDCVVNTQKFIYFDYGIGFELLNKFADKGCAVKEIVKHLNKSITNCIFIGDNINDISMFELGGYNVVMDNAKDEIKKYANYVTKSNNEDGVAKFLEKMMEETYE